MKKDPLLAQKAKEVLALIRQISPGKSVELRVLTYGAIQCVSGSNHKRGTPPNIVEMSGKTLIKLINQPSLWHLLCEVGEIQASGVSSDLSVTFTKAAAKYLA